MRIICRILCRSTPDKATRSIYWDDKKNEVVADMRLAPQTKTRGPNSPSDACVHLDGSAALLRLAKAALEEITPS